MSEITRHWKNGGGDAVLAKLVSVGEDFGVARGAEVFIDKDGSGFGSEWGREAAIFKNGEEALETDREAAGASGMTAEFFDHMIIATAAGDGRVEAVDGAFKNWSGVVSHATDEGGTKNNLGVWEIEGVDSGNDEFELISDDRVDGSILEAGAKICNAECIGEISKDIQKIIDNCVIVATGA